MNEKVLIGVPTSRTVWGDCLKSLLGLAQYNHDSVDFSVVVGCEVGVARDNMVKQTLDGGYKGLCFIDSDQTFPPDALDMLVRTDRDVIGYVIRASRQECLNMGNFCPNKYQQMALTEYPKDSVFEVDWIGNGFTYVKREVLEKISYSWFHAEYVADGEGRMFRLHSDFNFSLKVKEAGFKIWCSSQARIGHMSIIARFPPNEVMEK